jgi:hypothetical protein
MTPPDVETQLVNLDLHRRRHHDRLEFLDNRRKLHEQHLAALAGRIAALEAQLTTAPDHKVAEYNAPTPQQPNTLWRVAVQPLGGHKYTKYFATSRGMLTWLNDLATPEVEPNLWRFKQGARLCNIWTFEEILHE